MVIFRKGVPRRGFFERKGMVGAKVMFHFLSHSARRAFIFLVMIPVSFSGFPDVSQAQDYQVGPGDVLTITVFAGGELQQELNLTVSEEGVLKGPFIGSIQAEGKPLRELESEITQIMEEDYFVNPQVTVSIREYHSLHYYISGAVQSPGSYETSSKASLLDLLAKAGGPIAERRDDVAYILREASDELTAGETIENLLSHKEPIKVDLKKLLEEGDTTYNLILQSGDVVYIPFRKAPDFGSTKIIIQGEVNSPGIYDYQEGLTALTACIMAGGFAQFAAPNRTKIYRKKEGGEVEVIKINLKNVQKGKSPDLKLEPGDRIEVPETWL